MNQESAPKVLDPARLVKSHKRKWSKVAEQNPAFVEKVKLVLAALGDIEALIEVQSLEAKLAEAKRRVGS